MPHHSCCPLFVLLVRRKFSKDEQVRNFHKRRVFSQIFDIVSSCYVKEPVSQDAFVAIDIRDGGSANGSINISIVVGSQPQSRKCSRIYSIIYYWYRYLIPSLAIRNFNSNELLLLSRARCHLDEKLMRIDAVQWGNIFSMLFVGVMECISQSPKIL